MCANIKKKNLYSFRVSPQSNHLSLNDSQQKTKTSTQDIFLNGGSARYAEGDNANRSKCKLYFEFIFVSVVCYFLLYFDPTTLELKKRNQI